MIKNRGLYFKTPNKNALELMQKQKSYLEKPEVHFSADKLYMMSLLLHVFALV